MGIKLQAGNLNMGKCDSSPYHFENPIDSFAIGLEDGRDLLQPAWKWKRQPVELPATVSKQNCIDTIATFN
jgi:hypothetical protein